LPVSSGPSLGARGRPVRVVHGEVRIPRGSRLRAPAPDGAATDLDAGAKPAAAAAPRSAGHVGVALLLRIGYFMIQLRDHGNGPHGDLSKQ
jgi:hypothetical protein